MKVLITGGTGFLGQKLTESLTADGHQLTILSRSTRASGHRMVEHVKWNAKEMPPAIGLFDVVINLAGASIAEKKWTEPYKKLILSSRVNSTRACVEYINKSPKPPQVFISASAVGYYGADRPEKVTEDDSPGSDFVAEVCKQWEAEALKAKCRTVIPRIGVVLGVEGGALPVMMTAYQLMLGGKFGSGKQGFPWVHVDDIIGFIRYAIDHAKLEGPYNLAAPELRTQKEFSDALAKAVKRPAIFAVPQFMLKLGLGERSVLFTGGQRPDPAKAIAAGYEFRFPELQTALRQLVE